jgi:hypothetical protein
MKTKIDERREREQFDRENPWRSMAEAVSDGSVCELLFSDMAGNTASRPALYFLHDDGRTWYRVDQPGKAFRRPMNWRAFGKTLTPEDRRKLILREQRDTESILVQSAREYDWRNS